MGKMLSVEAKVMRIFAVTEIEYEFDEARKDVGQLKKYFIEKRKDYVLQMIIKNKINIGGYLVFLEPDQESGVWHVKLKEIIYWCDTDENDKTLTIGVDLDDYEWD